MFDIAWVVNGIILSGKQKITEAEGTNQAWDKLILGIGNKDLGLQAVGCQLIDEGFVKFYAFGRGKQGDAGCLGQDDLARQGLP